MFPLYQKAKRNQERNLAFFQQIFMKN